MLRYPGSKARFLDLIRQSLELNSSTEKLFVEPFCGGASISIALLETKAVGSIAINDSDPLIASLWMTVFSEDANWLADQVKKIPLTLDEWKRQRDLKPKTVRTRALKCLFLNRTSFNGILQKSAGPIGGWEQKNTLLVAASIERCSQSEFWP